MSTSKHQNRSYNISNRTRKFAAGKASLALALAAAAALGLSSLPSGAAHGADVTATWQDAANGAWDNGNNWNTAPNYPMNGNPSGDVYNVVIPLVTAGTSVDLNGLTSPAAIGSLSLASGMTITNSNSSSQTLIIDPSTLSTEVATSISGGIGASFSSGGINLQFGAGNNVTQNATITGQLFNNLTLTVDESGGTVTLSGTNNTYTGGTNVEDGAVLSVAASGNLGNSGITFGTGGGTLLTTGGISFGNAVTLNGTGTINNDGNNDTFSGQITGGSALIVTGAGTVTLSDNLNTYSGLTTIAGGATLSVGTSGDLGTTSGITFGTGGGTLLTTGGITEGSGVPVVLSGGANTVNTNIINTDGNIDTFSGAVTGVGSLTVEDTSGTGLGVVNLSGTNTYQGGTFVTSGTLHLFGTLFSGGNLTLTGTSTFKLDHGALQQINTLSGTASTTIELVVAGDNLQVDGGGNFVGTITGFGGLTASGNNTLTISGDNTYQDGTTVENGSTINFQNTTSNFGTGTVTFGIGGGTLQYGANGIIVGNTLDVANNGTIDVAGNNNETWSGQITGGGALTFTDSAGGGKLFLTNTSNNNGGGDTLKNGIVVNFNASNSFGSGPITFGTGGGEIQYGLAGLNVGNQLNVNHNGIIDAGGFGTEVAPETYSGTIVDGSTSTLTVQNGTVNLTANNNFVNFTTGALEIGNGSGTSIVQFASTNNLPGSNVPIILNDGRLQYIGTINVTVNNPLQLNAGANLIDVNGVSMFYTGQISGNSNLDAVNSNATQGALVLSQIESYTGNTEVGSTLPAYTGEVTLTLANGGTLQSTTNLTVDANGIFNIDNGFTQTVASLTGAAGGGVELSSGNLIITNGNLNGAGTTFAGNISGGGKFTFTGADSGTLDLTGTNSYTGGTFVNGGTLELGTGGSLNPDGNLTVNNSPDGPSAFFDLNNGTGQTIATLSGSGTIDLVASTDGLTVDDGGVFSGDITGAGGLTINAPSNGSATLTLSGANTYTGPTSIGNGATLDVANTLNITDLSGAAGSGIVLGGGFTLTVAPTTADTFAGNITGDNTTGLIVNGTGGGSLNITGSLANYDGLTTIENGGTLGIALAADLPSTDAFAFSSASGTTTQTLNLFDGGTTTLGAINLGTSGTDVISGGGITNTVILGGAITGSGTAVMQLDDGTFQLAPSGVSNNAGFTAQTLQIGDGSDPTVVQFASGNGLALPASTVGIALDEGTFQYAGPNSSLTVGNNISVSGANNNVINGGGLTGPTNGLLFSGNLSGPGNLELTNGQFALSGTNSGFTGNLDLSDAKGTVLVALTSASAVTGGGITFDGGTLVNDAGTVTFATNAITVNNHGGTIDTHGNQTILEGSLSGTGPLALTSSTTGASAIEFTAANTGYTGTTTISNGVAVQLGNSAALGSGGAGNNITINNTITGTNGFLQFAATSLNVANNLALAGNGTIDADGNTGTYSGVISGPGALTVMDSTNSNAAVTLTAAETNTGGTTVGDATGNAVTLNVGNGTSGSLTSGGNLTVDANATVNVNNNAGQTVGVLNGVSTTTSNVVLTAASDNLTVTNGGTFNGIVSGAGGLTLTGGGLTLSGANTYTGGTTVTGGVLNVTGSLAASGNVNVTGGEFEVGNSFTIANLNGNSSSVLNLVGTNVLTVNPSEADIFAGAVIGSGGLTVNGTNGSLDLSGDMSGFTGALDATNGGSITVTGTSRLNSSVVFNISNNLSIGATYSNLNGNAVTFGAAGITGGSLYITGTSGSTGTVGTITLADTTTPNSNLIDAGGASNTLNLGAITSALGATSVLTLQNGTFNLGNNTGFAGGTLQVGGGTNLAATAKFGSANDLPGSSVALVLNNGDMQFGGNGITVDNTSITVDAAGGSFDINGTTGSTISGAIAINGLLTLENTATGGGGTLTLQPLTGANSGSGGVNVDSGLTVKFYNGTSFGTGTVTLAAAGDTLQYAASVTTDNTLDVANAGTIDVAGNTGTWLGQITGSGPLTFTDSVGGGELILANTSTTNPNNNTGGDTLQKGILVNFDANSSFGTGTITFGTGGGTLQYGLNTLKVANSLDVANAGTIDVAGNNNETFSGQITGNGALTLDDSTRGGTGKLFLTGDNSGLGGGVTIEDLLTVNFNNNNALGSGPVTIAATGGTLQYGANGLNIQDILNMAGAGVIDVAGNNNETWSGAISGTGALTLNTSAAGGKLFLTGNNSNLSGGVTVENGLTVNFDNTVSASSNFGSAAVTIAATGATLQYGAPNLTVGNGLVLDNTGVKVAALDAAGNTGTWSGVISGSGALTLTSSAANGVLILNGVNTYTGATNVINGVTAVAGNSNAFGHATVPSDLLTLSGTGSTVDSINSYNLSQNTLLSSATGETINLGGYTQTSGTALNLVAFGRPTTPSNYDSLNLGTGAVNLAGTLNLAFSTVSDATFRPADFDKYTIVTTTGTNNGVAGAGTVANTSVEHGGSTYGTGWLAINPNSTNLDLNYYEADPAGSETVTIQTLFAPDAQTPNEQAVATYIDQYINPSNANVPPDIASALANLSLQSPGEIALLLNGLTPQAYAGLADEAFQNSTFLNQEVFTQVQQTFQEPGFNTSGLTLLNSSDQNPFAISMESQMKSAQQQAKNSVAYLDPSTVGYPQGYVPPPAKATYHSGWSGFVLGTITIDEQANNGSYSQRDTTGGVLGGLDYRLNRNLIIGAFFNWGYTGGTVDNFNSAQQNNSYTPGLFAGYQKHNFYLDALVSYTYNTYKLDRNIDIPGSASVATAEPHSNQYDAGILGGYNLINTHGLKIGPAAGVGFTQMNISASNETGSPFDLSVSKQHADSLRTLLGAQGQYAFTLPHMTLPVNLNFDAFWQHECRDSARGITSSFSQISGGQFMYGTPGPTRNSALLGLGASGYLAKGVSLFVNYQTQIGSKSQFAQTVMAGVAVSF